MKNNLLVLLSIVTMKILVANSLYSSNKNLNDLIESNNNIGGTCKTHVCYDPHFKSCIDITHNTQKPKKRNSGIKGIISLVQVATRNNGDVVSSKKGTKVAYVHIENMLNKDLYFTTYRVKKGKIVKDEQAPKVLKSNMSTTFTVTNHKANPPIGEVEYYYEDAMNKKNNFNLVFEWEFHLLKNMRSYAKCRGSNNSPSVKSACDLNNVYFSIIGNSNKQSTFLNKIGAVKVMHNFN